LAIEQGLAEELTADGNQLIMQNRLIENESPDHRAQERRKMAAYRFDQAVLDEFAALLRAIGSAGIEPIVVDLPVTDQFTELAPEGTADYVRYQRALADTAAAEGTDLIDLSSVELDPAVHFADVNHLNAAGRTTLTAALDRRLDRCPDPG
jgi:hypothetical protein